MIAVIYIYFVLSGICQNCLYHQQKIDTRSVVGRGKRVGGMLVFYLFLENIVHSRVRVVRRCDGTFVRYYILEEWQ
jgi:hypothetical protein